MDFKGFKRNEQYRLGSNGKVEVYCDKDFVGSMDALLRRHRYHCEVEKTVRRRLPAALAEHCRVACVEDGELVLCVQSHIVANRIKMFAPQIARDMAGIHAVTVRVNPQNLPPPREKTPREPIPAEAAAALDRVAQQFERDNRPQLAATFRRMTAALQKK